MKEIRHQLIESFFHYLQCFIPPRWCKIFSINSSSWDVAMIRIQNTVTYLTVRPPSWMAPEPAGDPSSFVMYFDYTFPVRNLQICRLHSPGERICTDLGGACLVSIPNIPGYPGISAQSKVGDTRVRLAAAFTTVQALQLCSLVLSPLQRGVWTKAAARDDELRQFVAAEVIFLQCTFAVGKL